MLYFRHKVIILDKLKYIIMKKIFNFLCEWFSQDCFSHESGIYPGRTRLDEMLETMPF